MESIFVYNVIQYSSSFIQTSIQHLKHFYHYYAIMMEAYIDIDFNEFFSNTGLQVKR